MRFHNPDPVSIHGSVQPCVELVQNELSHARHAKVMPLSALLSPRTREACYEMWHRCLGG